MSSSGGSVADLFERGLRDHQAGRLRQAEAAYRAIMAVEPDHADALHLLGVIAHQNGCNELAEDHIRRAIGVRAHATYFGNLGAVLCDLGRLGEAEASYREALRLNPDFPEAHNNLASAQNDLGRQAEAETSYREALCLRPDYPEAHNNLGNTLRNLGRFTEAERSYREALRLRPDFPEARNNLGNVLHAFGRPAEAEASYREAFRLRPDYPEAHNNLGCALHDLGRPAEAEVACGEALRLRPDYPDAHNNLGMALRALGRPAEAEASYRKAVRLRPDYFDAHNNLGNTLVDLGRPAEAEVNYGEALRLRPDFPDAHNNLGLALLLAGRFEEGWEEYEWRWKAKHLSGSARGFPAPLWSGETIGDRVILLYAEQGLGDTLQFCRYVPLVAAGAKTILEVQAPLARLLSQLPGVTQLVARGDKLPSFDLQCPLLSLPRAFGTTLETIPAKTPYLAADPVLAAHWRERLVGLEGLKVGLVWAGGRRLHQSELAAIDRRRSITLEIMAPLGEVSGVSFVSLQKGEPVAQTANPPGGLRLWDFTAELHDFADTAALVEGLDLVISVDTAVAHLAGALGKPVWLLNRFDTCWRWLLNREDSPWYRTLRQFRQPSPGDWNSVIDATRNALQRLAVTRGPQRQRRKHLRSQGAEPRVP